MSSAIERAIVPTNGQLSLASGQELLTREEAAIKDRASQIIEHREDLESTLACGFRAALCPAVRIGLVVKQAQNDAGPKLKTKAVDKLAAQPGIGLKARTLHQYLRLVKQLPKKLNIPEADFLQAVTKRNEFERLVGGLTLADAWKLLNDDNKIPFFKGSKKQKRRTKSKEVPPNTVKKDISARPLSLHFLCDNDGLAAAIRELENQGYAYHSVAVGCRLESEGHGSEDVQLVVNGIRDGARPEHDGFGDWFSTKGSSNDVKRLLTERHYQLWPHGKLVMFSLASGREHG